MNSTLIFNFSNHTNTITDAKYIYCFDYVKEKCVQAGYNQILSNQNTIILLLGVIIIYLLINKLFEK